MGLVGISPPLPAARLSLLPGVRAAVRDGCLGLHNQQVSVLEMCLTTTHRSVLSSLLSEMTLLALHLPLVSQGTLTGPRRTLKEIKVKRSHLWVRG